ADAGLETSNSSGNYSGVAYPDTEAVRVSCLPPLDANLISLVSHEANHVITRNGLGRARTQFVNEGSASALVSSEQYGVTPASYYQWTRTHRHVFPGLAPLTDDGQW